MFRFTETIIRELSACASLKVQCWLWLHIVIWSYAYTARSTCITGLNKIQITICNRSQHCTFSKAQAENSDDGLYKPKHVGATIVILNGFNCLTIL